MAMLFFTCLAIVLVPVLAIFFGVISRSSQLVILAIGSSFFWLLAILISSLFEPIIQASILAPLSVLLQELVRFGFWKLYDYAFNKGLFKDDKTKTTNFMAAVAIGWGFGFTQLMLTYVAALSHSTGPGLLVSPACPNISVFYINGIIMLAVSFLHLIWTIIAFDGYNQSIYWRPVFVGIVHLAVVLSTVLIHDFANSCAVSICVIYGLLGLSFYVLWWTVVNDNSLISRRPWQSV